MIFSPLPIIEFKRKHRKLAELIDGKFGPDHHRESATINRPFAER